MSEFAIVAIIVVLLVAAVFEFGHVFFAQQYLNSVANTMLERSAYEPDLETPGDDGTENDAALERIRVEAMDRLAAHFQNGTGARIGSHPHVAYGRRITSIEIDIGERDQNGLLRTNLRSYLRDNPVVVTITTEFDSFFKFFPSWTLRSEMAGFVEPRNISTLGSIYDCTGQQLTVDDILAGVFPSKCPCVDIPGSHEGVIKIGGICQCVNPFYVFADGTGLGEANGALDHGNECVCNTNITNENGNFCSCKTCEERGYVGAVLNEEDCSCQCASGYQLTNQNECVCANDSQGGCTCDLAQYQASFCDADGSTAVKEGGRCFCKAPCPQNGCQGPGSPSYECACDTECLDEQCSEPWQTSNSGSCSCGCNREIRLQYCPNPEEQYVNWKCQCRTCGAGADSVGNNQCGCTNQASLPCWNDNKIPVCNCQCGDPCPLNQRRTTRLSCSCRCHNATLRNYCHARQQIPVYGNSCSCKDCPSPQVFLPDRKACGCEGSDPPGLGYQWNGSQCEWRCPSPSFIDGGDCKPQRCLATGCSWNGSGWGSNE